MSTDPADLLRNPESQGSPCVNSRAEYHCPACASVLPTEHHLTGAILTMKKLALYLFHPVLGEVAVLEREPSISKSAGEMPTFALAGPQWLESRRPFLSKSTLATYKE